MPEAPEIDTDKLHEAIHEEMEKEEHSHGGLLKRIALTTAVLAAFAAVSALMAGSTANNALILKTESTQLQAQASDQWAYYQAKGVKSAVMEATRATWEAAGKKPPEAVDEKIARYAKEQEEIKGEAKKLEKERDEQSEKSEHQLHIHHQYANSVALFQVAIALGALAALTRLGSVWIASLALGLSGIGLFVRALLM